MVQGKQPDIWLIHKNTTIQHHLRILIDNESCKILVTWRLPMKFHGEIVGYILSRRRQYVYEYLHVDLGDRY